VDVDSQDLLLLWQYERAYEPPRKQWLLHHHSVLAVLEREGDEGQRAGCGKVHKRKKVTLKNLSLFIAECYENRVFQSSEPTGTRRREDFPEFVVDCVSQQYSGLKALSREMLLATIEAVRKFAPRSQRVELFGIATGILQAGQNRNASSCDTGAIAGAERLCRAPTVVQCTTGASSRVVGTANVAPLCFPRYVPYVAEIITEALNHVFHVVGGYRKGDVMDLLEEGERNSWISVAQAEACQRQLFTTSNLWNFAYLAGTRDELKVGKPWPDLVRHSLQKDIDKLVEPSEGKGHVGC